MVYRFKIIFVAYPVTMMEFIHSSSVDNMCAL